MNHKNKIYGILITSVIAISISLVLALPEKFGLCAKNDINCLHSYIDNFNEIIQVIFFLSIPVVIISFVLLFLREQVFNAWSKFAVIFLPVAVILIIITPTTKKTIIDFDKESVTLLLASIFLITSLLIIFIKSFKLRREGR